MTEQGIVVYLTRKIKVRLLKQFIVKMEIKQVLVDFLQVWSKLQKGHIQAVVALQKGGKFLFLKCNDL